MARDMFFWVILRVRVIDVFFGKRKCRVRASLGLHCRVTRTNLCSPVPILVRL